MNRYYFEIPSSNVFGLFWAKSKLDAQHQLMNSKYAPFYGQVRWLSSDNDYNQSQAATIVRFSQTLASQGA